MLWYISLGGTSRLAALHLNIQLQAETYPS